MRGIVMDTETTGFDPRSGDRLVEIGCVELIDRRETGVTMTGQGASILGAGAEPGASGVPKLCATASPVSRS